MNIKSLFFSTKKTIKTLLVLIGIFSVIAGGLVYANSRYSQNISIERNISITLGMYGTYKAVYDIQKKQWTLGIWNETKVIEGIKTLTDLQKEGGVITFVMPFDGVINSNAGEVYIDGQKWRIGNPIKNDNNNIVIKAGKNVELRYGANNQSAGFQIWFY